MDESVERAVLAVVDRVRRSQFIPGGVVGLVRPEANAEGLSTKVIPFGVEDVDTGRRVDAATSFEIGSLTKLFTAVVLASAMSAVDAPVTMDTPVQDFTRVRVPRWGSSEMTVGHLVTHRSGLPKMPGNAVHGPAGRSAYGAGDIWSALAASPLTFSPGSSWLYSNFGFGLLGTLLAERTGRPFGRLVDDIVCRPLGLGATGLEHPAQQASPPARPSWWRPLVASHARESAVEGVSTGYATGSTSARPLVAQRWDNTGAMAGSGGLVSNGTDLTRFLAAAAGYGSAPPSAALAQTRRPVPADVEDARPMGMAWQIRRSRSMPPMLFKNGGTSGMHGAMAVRPQGEGPGAGTGVVVLTNGPDHVDDLVVELMGILASMRLADVSQHETAAARTLTHGTHQLPAAVPRTTKS